MTVQGQRTVLELRGESSIPIELVSDPQKAICSSRSFGKRVKKLSELEEAISEYASRAAEKLRKENQLTQTVQIFIETSRFLKEGRYFNNITIKLPTATSATSHIVKEAVKGIRRIYKHGFEYKKCGIILLELSPENSYQFDMFRDQVTPNYSKDSQISSIMDYLNRRWGKDTVMLASQGVEKEWKMNQEYVSQRYTTVWSELMNVNLSA
jgi:DNA polymerase V